jgi:beta-lactamase superfamily II metal-dependent hydrolase
MKPFSLFLMSLLLPACAPVLPIDNPFEDAETADSVSPTVSAEPLRIFVLDVGQGDATLVVGPGRKTLLIDAGPPGAGTDPILPFLEERDIRHLDWIVATHYDADHIGGIAEVLRGPDGLSGTEDDHRPREACLDRGEATDKDTPVYEDYLAVLPERRLTAEPGMVLDLGEDATATVIVVNGRFADGRAIHLNPDEENEASIALLIRYGDFEYFTAGDLTGGGSPGGRETKDLETFAGEIVGDIDVLHAGHHGSASSTNPDFLQLTRPEAVVISVGADNDYGHPSSEVLARIETAGANVHRTDLSGTLEIVTDGREFDILTRP